MMAGLMVGHWAGWKAVMKVMPMAAMTASSMAELMVVKKVCCLVAQSVAPMAAKKAVSMVEHSVAHWVPWSVGW